VLSAEACHRDGGVAVQPGSGKARETEQYALSGDIFGRSDAEPWSPATSKLPELGNSSDLDIALPAPCAGKSNPPIVFHDAGPSFFDPQLGESDLRYPAPPPAAPYATAPFDRGAAAASLGAVYVHPCKRPDGPTGSGHVTVTFSPDGSVQSAVVDQPPFAGTAVGACVAGRFRGARVPAFCCCNVTVGKSFVIQ
jgi:hypothetical protein